MSTTSGPHWRAGTKVHRTIYQDLGDGNGEQLIGMMDTPELAALVVAAVNAYLQSPAADDDASN